MTDFKQRLSNNSQLLINIQAYNTIGTLLKKTFAEDGINSLNEFNNNTKEFDDVSEGFYLEQAQFISKINQDINKFNELFENTVIPMIVHDCIEIGKNKEQTNAFMKTIIRNSMIKVHNDIENITDKNIFKDGENVSLLCCEKTKQLLEYYYNEIYRLLCLISKTLSPDRIAKTE